MRCAKRRTAGAVLLFPHRQVWGRRSAHFKQEARFTHCCATDTRRVTAL